MREPDPSEIIIEFFGSRETESFDANELRFTFGPGHYILGWDDGRKTLIPKSSVERVEVGKDVIPQHIIQWREIIEREAGEEVPTVDPRPNGSS